MLQDPRLTDIYDEDDLPSDDCSRGQSLAQCYCDRCHDVILYAAEARAEDPYYDDTER